MPSPQHPMAPPTWTIRSVPLRSRAGLERLDQAYRRLLDPAPVQPSPGPDDVLFGRIAAQAPDTRR